jgi:hypothetical protein
VGKSRIQEAEGQVSGARFQVLGPRLGEMLSSELMDCELPSCFLPPPTAFCTLLNSSMSLVAWYRRCGLRQTTRLLKKRCSGGISLSWFLTAGTPLGDYVEHTHEELILEACIRRGSVDRP